MSADAVASAAYQFARCTTEVMRAALDIADKNRLLVALLRNHMRLPQIVFVCCLRGCSAYAGLGAAEHPGCCPPCLHFREMLLFVAEDGEVVGSLVRVVSVMRERGQPCIVACLCRSRSAR